MVTKFDLNAEKIVEFLNRSLEHSDSYKHIGMKNVVDKQTSHFMKSDDLSTLIVLVNRPYSEQNIKTIINKANNSNLYESIIPIFFKDTENYFRSAKFTNETELESVDYKKNTMLKKYSVGELNRAIHLGPSERMAFRNRNQEIMYYQPKSERLQELIVKHSFTPIIYNYSHLDPEERPNGMLNRISTEKFLWIPEKKEEHKNNIYFRNNKIYSKTEPQKNPGEEPKQLRLF